MFDDQPQKQPLNSIILGADLSEMSVDDIDERIEALETEIGRLKEERARKVDHLAAAQSFFKS